MTREHPICEDCRAAGLLALAAYVPATGDEGLDGPGMGDPDYWPEAQRSAPALCQSHYLRLTAEAQCGYRRLDWADADEERIN